MHYNYFIMHYIKALIVKFAQNVSTVGLSFMLRLKVEDDYMTIQHSSKISLTSYPLNSVHFMFELKPT